MFQFYTPWKHQKISGYLLFSGGIEVEYWAENALKQKQKLNFSTPFSNAPKCYFCVMAKWRRKKELALTFL